MTLSGQAGTAFLAAPNCFSISMPAEKSEADELVGLIRARTKGMVGGKISWGKVGYD